MQEKKTQKGVLPRKARPLFVFFILCISCSVYAESSNKLTDAEYHNLASESAENKLWQDAINYEKNACDLNPANTIYSKQLSIYYNNYAMILLENDRYDLALTNFKEALRLDARNNTIKDNIYNATLQEAEKGLKNGRLQESINLTKDCISYNPDKSSAYIFLGSIYYQNNSLNEAIEYWQRALAIEPADLAVKEMLDKAKKELSVEKDFKTRTRAYFNIIFEGEENSGLVWDIMDMLEDARRKLKSDFNFFTEGRITVVIYNSEQFKQARLNDSVGQATPNALDWTLGLYDGKIRLRVGDILSKDQSLLRRIIYHEYAHAILHTLYPNNIPTWLHEGFAKLSEPQQPLLPQEKNLLSEIKKQGSFDLDKINSIFKSGNLYDINLAYLKSKLFLQYLIDTYGKYKFEALLKKLNSGMPLEDITYDIYKSHIEGLENEFIKSMLT